MKVIVMNEQEWMKIRSRLEDAETLSPAEKVAAWEALDRPVPPPSAYKQQLVREYAARFTINTLVETGTWHGDMVDASLDHFDHIYSIELGQKLAHRAIKRFADCNNVSIRQGDSTRVLPAVMDEINEPTLFWLDAHYSMGDTAKGELFTPIRQELAAILGHHIKGHVILIDDAREFLGRADYPSVVEIQDQVLNAWPRANISTEHDVIRIVPAA